MFIGFGDLGITGYRSKQLWSWRNDGSRNEVMEDRGVHMCLGSRGYMCGKLGFGRMDGSIGRIMGKKVQESTRRQLAVETWALNCVLNKGRKGLQGMLGNIGMVLVRVTGWEDLKSGEEV